MARRRRPWKDDPVMKLAARRVKEAHRQVSESEDRLRVRVLEAKAAGMTWDDIGALLGVSRQAAHNRFAAYELEGEG